MVVGTLEQVPSRGRISIMRIQQLTVQKRYSVIRLAYGILLVVIGIIVAAINPVHLFTNWYLDMREGSFLYKLWEKPTYQLFSEMWVYNYTNTQEYLSGADKVMKLKEIGPFLYQEQRTNENMKIDKERGVVTMNPRLKLKFMKEKSLDDTKNVNIVVPNIALIALGTLAADKLGYLANAGAYYSMSALGSKPFKALTVEKLLWGYYDPLVTVANKVLPGWIDFSKLGLVDRFYSGKMEWTEVELGNISRRYSLNSWDNSSGIVEQGFKDLNTSTLCNRIKGSYEGIMLHPSFPKGENFSIFRKQACRNYPFTFIEEKTGDYGFPTYRYTMAEDAFSVKSPYACECEENCLPDGFVDVSQCYYGFPIALSKPHFVDADPLQQSFYEGMHFGAEKDVSHFEVEPTIGAPISFAINIQINIAVRTSPGNPLTASLKNKIVPLMWFSLYCEQPPSDIISLLRLRLVIAPPLVITIIIVIIVAGLLLTGQGLYKIWKPKYKLLDESNGIPLPVRRKSQERRRSSVIMNLVDNIAFKQSHDDLAKEAVSLLAINEDEGEFHDLLISDYECD